EIAGSLSDTHGTYHVAVAAETRFWADEGGRIDAAAAEAAASRRMRSSRPLIAQVAPARGGLTAADRAGAWRRDPPVCAGRRCRRACPPVSLPGAPVAPPAAAVPPRAEW